MLDELSRRERQIMAALYRMGEGSAQEVVSELGEADALDSIRVTLGILERKGHVTHRSDGPRHVYRPSVAPQRAAKKAAGDLVRTFFQESPGRAVLALLDATDRKLTAEELDAIAARIEEARRRKQ